MARGGTLYVADTGNHAIRKITLAGDVTTLAGGIQGFADASGTDARFSTPTGVAADAAGNVYVADYGNHRIRKIFPDGSVATLAGNGNPGFADGTGAAAQFYYPFGIETGNDGNLLVGDTANCRIRRVTPAGVVNTVAGSGYRGTDDGSAAAAKFDGPYGLAWIPAATSTCPKATSGWSARSRRQGK